MSKRLYVGNLPYSTTEQDLLAHFAAFGATEAAVPRDPDGRSKGFGFVDVPEEQMQAAIDATNGQELGGRALNVNEARPKEARPRNNSYGMNA